jgi:hypothetical protein
VEKIKRFMRYIGIGGFAVGSLAYLAYRRAQRGKGTQTGISIEGRTDPVTESIHRGIGDAIAGTERGLESIGGEIESLSDDNSDALEIIGRIKDRARESEIVINNLKRRLTGEAEGPSDSDGSPSGE